MNREAAMRRRKEGARHSRRHLLVDTEGLVLKAKVHSAKIPYPGTDCEVVAGVGVL